jgi:DNA-binding GntR family transcriptional regulator
MQWSQGWYLWLVHVSRTSPVIKPEGESIGDLVPSDHQFSPIERRTLRREALQGLRTAILQYRIPPGTKLVEAELASQLGVSRVPIREALQRLEQEGLVKISPHKGAVVVGLDDQELLALVQVRAMIEEICIAQACSTATASDLSLLHELSDAVPLPGEGTDAGRIAELDIAFHRYIVDISHYAFLRHFWSSVDGIVRIRYEAMDSRPGSRIKYHNPEGVVTHKQIAEALESRDPARSKSAIRNHIVSGWGLPYE